MILVSREQSSMVSTWKEYLCLQPDVARGYRLFTGQYEALADREQFFNDETGAYDLPDEIDGKAVAALEDDYVVGGELSCFDDEQSVLFKSPDDPAVAQWLESSGWSEMVNVGAIRAAIGGGGGFPLNASLVT
jgi:hypothetical protein